MSLRDRRRHRHRRIGRANDCRRRQLADGDVIRVPVRAVGTESDDDVRFDAAQMAGNPADRFDRVDPIECTVGVIEAADLSDAEFTCGRPTVPIRVSGQRSRGRDIA